MKIYKYLACFALAAVAVFAVLAGSLNQDEGWYLYAARLVGEGKTLYGDFFFTQGPAMPLFYSKFNWIWENFGILGARVFTLTLGVLSIFFAAETAKKFVDEPHKAKVFWMVVLLLGSNLYHIYYLAIPKTYALASLALMVGFYFYFSAVEKKSAFYSFLAGAAFAVAASTRISLASAGVVAVFHIFSIRKFKRSVSFCFVLGAVMTGFFAYMPFLADAKAFDNLIAAHLYHASRDGLDFKLIAGSLSRVARWYLPVWFLIGLSCALPECRRNLRESGSNLLFIALAFSVTALVHLSAPNPYDDYQVPIMAIAAIFAAVRIAPARLPVVFLIAALVWCQTFGSPLLEKFMTNGHDRFWVVPKDSTELFQLRQVAEKIEKLDPGGKELLTQDLYLAIETNRRVPQGLEMGPFSYWGDVDGPVPGLNRKSMIELLESAPCKVAAGSGYMFAITAPSCKETDVETQLDFWNILKKNYSLAERIAFFGQNNTTLLLLSRKDKGVP